jgi:hypothetical protein
MTRHFVRTKVPRREARRRAKRLKHTDICDGCHEDLPYDDDSTKFKLVLPDGLSHETIMQAFEEAERAEEAQPSTEGERSGYAVLGACALQGVDDELDIIVMGRAIDRLGGHLLAMHPQCADKVDDVSSRYRTPGWGD